MQKIILALCFVLASALAYEQAHDEYRTDDFININRLQHKNVLKLYDTKLRQFNELYTTRIDGVDLHYELISASLEQTSERLNPIEILSDFTKQCVVKYRVNIPTIFDVKTAITKCVVHARTQQTVTIVGAVNVRNELEKYFENNFEKEVNNCGNTTSVAKYATCITDVTTKTNKFISENQKAFGVQLEAAVCVAKATVKKALDCTYTVQKDTVGAIAKATLLIDHCILVKDDCKPCNYKCNDVLELSYSELNGKVMRNPFYGRTDKPQCLIVTQKY